MNIDDLTNPILEDFQKKLSCAAQQFQPSINVSPITSGSPSGNRTTQGHNNKNSTPKGPK